MWDVAINVGEIDRAVAELVEPANGARAPDNVTMIAMDATDGAGQERDVNPLILGTAAILADEVVQQDRDISPLIRAIPLALPATGCVRCRWSIRRLPSWPGCSSSTG